ncbi:MAG: SNF2-related protein [Saprospiraceae bacterium]
MNNDSQTEKIIITDHFDIKKVEDLFEEYVSPVFGITDIPNEIIHEPRRLLGNYLTYLVHDGDDTHSVMINRSREKYSIQCDCAVYNNEGKCLHIAQVLVSMKTQCSQENRKKKLEEARMILAKEKKEKQYKVGLMNRVQSAPKNRPAPKPHPLEISEIQKPGDPSKPYIIADAKDFNYYRLMAVIPALRNVTKRNRVMAKVTGPANGFDINHQYLRERNKISYRVNQDNDIEITCSCRRCYENNLCQHSLDSIVYISELGNYSIFIPYSNQDSEKNKLLREYGLTLKDPEAQEFRFNNDYSGRLSLSYVPPHYISLPRLPKIRDLIISTHKVKKFKVKNHAHSVGLLFQLSHSIHYNAPVRIEATKIETGKKGEDKFSRIITGKEDSATLLSVLDDDQYNILMDFSFIVFKDQIGTGYYTSSYNVFSGQPYDATRKQYLKYFASKLEEHWHELSKWESVKLILENDSFSKSNLKNVKLAPQPVYADIRVSDSDRFITLEATFQDVEGREVIGVSEDKEIYFGKLILCGGILYLNKRNDLVALMESMPKGKLIFPAVISDNVIKDVLFPLSQSYGVNLPEQFKMQVRESTMIPAIHLKEFQDKFLQIGPKFCYDDIAIDMNDSSDHYFTETKPHQLLIRDTQTEQGFVEYIRSMHAQFKLQNYQPYFLIAFEDVMKNQWFIQFSKQLMAENIKMIGFNELTRFKYNTATPKWEMNVSSGIDWFDVKVTASWGEQVIGFKEIRKAIINGQDFVVLGDGSFGMLPEEWIKKYSSLFKFGVDDKIGLKISKKHFNIIEMLFDQISDEDIMAEIEDKKRKLLHIENVTTAPIPASIKATLRPYQETGYQWMQVLDEISWGGCLADDMGLGKTLQAITFLSFVKQKYNNPTSLIICPTSLIYNWENELKKFAPDLKYHLFYGMGRTFSDEHFNDYDIVISSYGIVRNDIETLVNFEWEYVILDESQAIKNPDAISTKAVQLLKARNRFILSGTPLQNNTFDIYSQFNFLNPGLLGGREFFRQEFANPVDKEGNKDAGMMLRRLIKPFMLRRTKSEVAPDLPEKTEMVLWCQMEKAQKAIYDEYKDYYRRALLQKIETDGMSKSGVYILEGLLRLRQICDDPRLIKDKDIKPTKGIKILELVREIQENMGEHKMLVFSQFTEMLALIREEMDANGITYCYLDGSTSAANRQDQVNQFQTRKDINVFLISLKAGGVGLNLTEADYVYIVDPWWNPAVEQQAIDRTHRIGQKNNIFAYKMICKDSVEEKIMQLQERKLNISKEIVQEDTAFFKSLTTEDISYLFS